jgi:hypothetical protein
MKGLGDETGTEDTFVHGRIILKWVSHSYDGGAWTVLLWLKIGDTWLAVVNTAKNLADSIKCDAFLHSSRKIFIRRNILRRIS